MEEILVCLGCHNIIPQTRCLVHNSDGGWEGKDQGISMVKVRVSRYEFWGDVNIQTTAKGQHLASAPASSHPNEHEGSHCEDKDSTLLGHSLE